MDAATPQKRNQTQHPWAPAHGSPN